MKTFSEYLEMTKEDSALVAAVKKHAPDKVKACMAKPSDALNKFSDDEKKAIAKDAGVPISTVEDAIYTAFNALKHKK